MFSANNILGIFGSLAVVALVTTLVLPGRQTAQVVTAGSQGFATDIRAAMGL